MKQSCQTLPFPISLLQIGRYYVIIICLYTLLRYSSLYKGLTQSIAVAMLQFENLFFPIIKRLTN